MHPIRSTLRLPRKHRYGRSGLPTLALAPLLVLGIVAAGCGDDDDDAAAGAASATTVDDPAGDDTASSDAATDPASEVVAVDYHFEGLPDRIDAGTRLTMRNGSEAEVHELFAMRIPPEETRSVDELVALPEGELFAAVPGEPALVLVAPPGEEAMPVIGDGTLDAGRYLVACAIPTGADPVEFMRQAQESQDGPPDVPGGPPHFTAGMFAELTVE
jgi:hypothetical protein